LSIFYLEVSGRTTTSALFAHHVQWEYVHQHLISRAKCGLREVADDVGRADNMESIVLLHTAEKPPRKPKSFVGVLCNGICDEFVLRDD
jgi:hypothetical protein